MVVVEILLGTFAVKLVGDETETPVRLTVGLPPPVVGMRVTAVPLLRKPIPVTVTAVPLPPEAGVMLSATG